MNFPILETERLTLNEIVTQDAESLFDLFSDTAVIKYYDLQAFEEISQATQLIDLFKSRFNSGSGIRWAIRENGSNKLIGTCGFNSWIVPMKSAVIGYDLNPTYWDKGIATEAVSSALEAAFSGRLACGRIHRVQADTVPGNDASERLLIRLGFHMEGIRRESGYWKGSFHDLKCYGLLEHEYKKYNRYKQQD